MKVCVQYTAQMRAITGTSEEPIELPSGSSLATLLSSLAKRWGNEGAAHLVAENGQPLRSLLVVVNDSAIASADIEKAILRDNDIITFYPPIAGG